MKFDVIRLFSRGNHKLVFKVAGFENIKEYTYWDPTNRAVNIEQLIVDLQQAPEK